MLSNSSGLAESRDDWLVAMRVWTPEANSYYTVHIDKACTLEKGGFSLCPHCFGVFVLRSVSTRPQPP